MGSWTRSEAARGDTHSPAKAQGSSTNPYLFFLSLLKPGRRTFWWSYLSDSNGHSFCKGFFPTD